jgi:hypothetical protein
MSDDGSRWRGPDVFPWLLCRSVEWVRRFGVRCRCAWLHHGSGPWTHRIQGCGAIDPRPKAGSPLIVIPTAPSVPSCSAPSRCGLAKGGVCRKVGATPNPDSACARRRERAWVGTKKQALGSNKETDEGKRCAEAANILDKKSLIQGNRGQARELWGFERSGWFDFGAAVAVTGHACVGEGDHGAT